MLYFTVAVFETCDHEATGVVKQEKGVDGKMERLEQG